MKIIFLIDFEVYPLSKPSDRNTKIIAEMVKFLCFKLKFLLQSSKATPIHEPTSEEPPVAYGTQHVYQKPEYDAAYKLPVAAKDYQTNNHQQYVKYDTKSALPKHQSIPNSNAYASIAPAYGYSAADSSLSSYVPPPRKFITYDPEKKVHVQYVIKYVPVPYTDQSHDQHYPQSPADASYATPQTFTYSKEAHKKTIFSHSQPLHSLNPVTYPTSTEGYYAENPKYAEAYAPSYDDAAQQPVYKSYSQPAYYAKYVDKNAKKYVPTSYVLATIGKSAPTHYSATIKHENGGHEHLYTSKLQPVASVPLSSFDKYSSQDYKSADESKSYSEPDYTYAVAGDRYKHGAVLPPASHVLAYDYNVPEQYQQHQQLLYFKKDVSASVSSTPSYEGSPAKV